MLSRELLAAPVLDVDGVDLEQADRVTYLLEQSFDYAYPEPVSNLRHRLHVVPPARHDRQFLTAHRVDVDGTCARRRSDRDAHGNTVVRVRADRVERGVRFEVGALIERRRHDVELVDAARLRDPRLLRPSALTGADGALRELAAELWQATDTPAERADRICRRVFTEMTYEWGVTGVGTTAADAFALRRGVCQDDAHVMLALCHELNVPARYVSGHLIGQGGTHAWVEVLLPAADCATAVGFDPCHGRRCDARYVTVAVGRDYRDVPPTSGSYVGRSGATMTTTRRVDVLSAA